MYITIEQKKEKESQTYLAVFQVRQQQLLQQLLGPESPDHRNYEDGNVREVNMHMMGKVRRETWSLWLALLT